mgnify:CR=1 FL=1
MVKSDGAHLLFVHCFLLSAREGEELDLDSRSRIAETALHELIRNRFLVCFVACLSDQLHVIVKMDPPRCVSEIDKCLRGAVGESLDFWDSGYGAATVSEWDIPRLSRFIKRLDRYSVADREDLMNRVVKVNWPETEAQIRN